MKRREILRILGWAATGAAASPMVRSADPDEQDRILRVIDSPGRLDGSVLDNMQEVLWRCMRQDDSLGPQAVLETVLAQRHLAAVLSRDCPRHLRDRLLSLWSNLSRFAGWLCFDLGSYQDAEYYYEDAREKAHAATDTPLGVMVLCNLSHLATWTGRPRLGIDHAAAAQGWARRVPDPLLRSYAADVAARAYARDGQDDACGAELDAAEREVRAAAGHELDPGSLAYFYGAGQLASTRGVCLLDLGRPERAVAVVEQALALIHPSFVRNRALAMVGLGRAHIRTGEVDEGARVITEASSLVARNRSVRTVRELDAVCGELGPWRETPAVCDLRDCLVSQGLHAG